MDQVTAAVYAEYRTLRGNSALKRLKRLENAGFQSAGVYRDYAWLINRPASKIAPSDIQQALADLKRFLYTEGSKVSEVRASYAQASAALKSHGYNIAPTDIPNFRRFMEQVTSRSKARLESSSAADMYSEMSSKGLLDSERNRRDVVANYEWYKRHMDDVEDLAEEMRGKRGGVSLADVRRKLGR